jgi:hypothetical protein
MLPDEARIQSQCFTWHWNTMPEERGRLILMYNNPRNEIAGAMLKGMGLREGIADLLYMRDVQIIGNGLVHPHFLECKTPTGRQSPAQKEFEKQVLAFGWRYDIFRSLGDFMKLILQK